MQRRVFGLPSRVEQSKFGLPLLDQASNFHLTTFGFLDYPTLSRSLNQCLVAGFFLAGADADAGVPLVLVRVPVVDSGVAVVDEDVVVVVVVDVDEDFGVDVDEDVVVDIDEDVDVYHDHFVVVVAVGDDGVVVFQFEHVAVASVDGFHDLLVGFVFAYLVVSHIG